MAIFSSDEFFAHLDKECELIAVPEMVELPLCAFCAFKSLKQVILPDSLVMIGERAFHGCHSLQAINLPTTLARIGIGAFADCRSLSKIELPDDVTEIGDCAFVRSGLTEITLPKNLQILGFNVFRSCRFLEKVTLPDGIKEIKQSQKLFEKCDNLKEISVCAECKIEEGVIPENCRVILRKE